MNVSITIFTSLLAVIISAIVFFATGFNAGNAESVILLFIIIYFIVIISKYNSKLKHKHINIRNNKVDNPEVEVSFRTLRNSLGLSNLILVIIYLLIIFIEYLVKQV